MQPSILMKASSLFLSIILPIIAEQVPSGSTMEKGLKMMMILLFLSRPMRAATWSKSGVIFANSCCVRASQLDRGGSCGWFQGQIACWHYDSACDNE